MNKTQETTNSSCPQCGATFHCGYQAGENTCWCFQLPHIGVDDTIAGCLCPKCLKECIQQVFQQNSSVEKPEH